MVLPTRISLSATADEEVGVRLLTLEPLEGSATISDMTLATRRCQYKRFSRCPLHGSHRVLYCYFETYCSALPFDSSRQSLRQPITNKRWQWQDNTEVTEERAADIEPITFFVPLAKLVRLEIS